MTADRAGGPPGAFLAVLSRLLRRLRTGPAATPEPVWLEAEKLAAALAEREAGCPVVVDVRGTDEFDGPLGHIADAINLPVDRLIADPEQLAHYRDRPVALVCRTDRRSATAAAGLAAAGFREVQVLRGGMQRWNSLALATQRDDTEQKRPALTGHPQGARS